MRRTISTGLLSCGIAMALLSPALAAITCATGTGPVPEGTTVVESCMGNPHPACPGQGPLFECRNGQWYCIYNSSNRRLHDQPCPPDKAGAWIWTSNGLRRTQ
jgi:hypothetical protein